MWNAPGMKTWVALVLAALVVGGPAAGGAQAQTGSHDDAAGDMYYEYVEYSADSFEPATFGFLQRAAHRGDVRRIDISHTRTHVVVGIRMRTMLSGYWGIQYRIVTPTRRFEVTSERSLNHSYFHVFTAQGDYVACNGMRRTFDREGAYARLIIPRGCLGGPRVVRVASEVYQHHDDGETAEGGYWYDGWRDDPLRDGGRAGRTLSPPIYSS